MKITVSAELGLSAEEYFVERDGAAFRSFIAQAGMEGAQRLWVGGAGTLVPACACATAGGDPLMFLGAGGARGGGLLSARLHGTPLVCNNE